MLGAIIGDIVGSRFEYFGIKNKDFRLFDKACTFTDDTVMTLAVAQAVLDNRALGVSLKSCAISNMQSLGRKYEWCGFGGSFLGWIFADEPAPYNSYGNGAGMRVSAVAWAAQTIEECVAMSREITEVSHNHSEGLKGAEAIAVCAFLALHGAMKTEIRQYVEDHYYPLDFSLDSIRADYRFDVSCMGTIPPANVAFLEATDFEDAIRNAVSLGGDSDTLAACTGAIAEAYFGVTTKLREHGISYLDERLKGILFRFEDSYPPKIV